MRTITLKMPSDGNGLDQWAGQQGEHRLSRLIIPLPREAATKIKSCVALFVLDDERSMISPLILAGDSGDIYFKGGKVYFMLWRDLTQCRSLRAQLECYSDDGGNDFIDRTPISERVMFGKSLSTCLHDFPEVSNRPSILAQLIARTHTHNNMSALSKIGESDNLPTWNDAPWPGGSGGTQFTIARARVREILCQQMGE